MTGTLWYQLNALRKGASRPAGVARAKVVKLGMMGAGIAQVAAQGGVDVVLIDAAQAAAGQGKARTQALPDKAVKRGRGTAQERDAAPARITPSTDGGLLTGCEWSSGPCSRIAGSGPPSPAGPRP